MIGDAGVDRGISDGLAMWIRAGDGWEAGSRQVGVAMGVEVDRGGGSTVWDGLGSDGCGEVDVTAELDVALEVDKTGGGKKSACGGGVLKRVPLMNLGMLDNLMTTEANKGLTWISPLVILQQGREEMHAASTTFCSTTLRFPKDLGNLKVKLMPGM